MVNIILFTVFTGILALVTAGLYFGKRYSLRILFKTLASMCFVFIGVFSLIYNVDVRIFFAGLVISGLILGLMGDMLLSIHPFLSKREADIFNFVGLVVFLVGHILYSAVFIYSAGGYSVAFSCLSLIIPGIFFIMLRAKVLNSEGKDLPLLVYALIISFMLVQALYAQIKLNNGISLLQLIAASVFVISDILLTFYNFSKFKQKFIMPISLIFYYSAQIMLALSIALI